MITNFFLLNVMDIKVSKIKSKVYVSIFEKQKRQSDLSVMSIFFLGKHSPDATEAFQLLPRRHLSLHHNGKGSLATRNWCCRVSTSSVGYKPHQRHPSPPGFTSCWVSINEQQLSGLQGKCRCWGSNRRSSRRHGSDPKSPTV